MFFKHMTPQEVDMASTFLSWGLYGIATNYMAMPSDKKTELSNEIFSRIS